MLSEGNIVLRPLLERDKQSLAALANNKKIWDNVRDRLPFPYTEKDAEDFISFVSQENPQMTFAIEFNKELCGVIGLVGQTDIHRKSAEVGYWIGEPFWNKGIATTAVKLITEYGFYQLDFIRIYAGIFEYNIGSMRVLEKNGYVKDAVFRKALIKNNQIWDEHMYSIVKD